MEERKIVVNANRLQTDYYLGESATQEEFHKVYDKLMDTTWFVAPIGSNEYRLYNLLELGWSFGYHKKKTVLGTCNWSKRTIYISAPMLKANLDINAREFEDTVRHEIAHAIDREIRGKSGHDEDWKHIAVQLGAEPIRKANVKSPPHKWTLTCGSCKRVVRRHKLTTRSKRMACGECCRSHNRGAYDPKYIFTIEQNF